MNGELPVPQNWEDVDALGESMKAYNTSKVWAAVVDGELGLQNGQQEFRNYYTNEILGMCIFTVRGLRVKPKLMDHKLRSRTKNFKI